jgi:hypothetical protein
VYWRKGATNLADYHTKHHPASHHQAMCPIYLPESTSQKFFAGLNAGELLSVLIHPLNLRSGEGVMIARANMTSRITSSLTSPTSTCAIERSDDVSNLEMLHCTVARADDVSNAKTNANAFTQAIQCRYKIPQYYHCADSTPSALNI